MSCSKPAGHAACPSAEGGGRAFLERSPREEGNTHRKERVLTRADLGRHAVPSRSRGSSSATALGLGVCCPCPNGVSLRSHAD